MKKGEDEMRAEYPRSDFKKLERGKFTEELDRRLVSQDDAYETAKRAALAWSSHTSRHRFLQVISRGMELLILHWKPPLGVKTTPMTEVSR